MMSHADITVKDSQAGKGTQSRRTAMLESEVREGLAGEPVSEQRREWGREGASATSGKHCGPKGEQVEAGPPAHAEPGLEFTGRGSEELALHSPCDLKASEGLSGEIIFPLHYKRMLCPK